MDASSSDKDVAVCAALSSILTKSVLHPIDTIKCRLQAGEHGPGLRSFVHYYKGKWSLSHLYRGLGIKLVMYVPFQSIYITSYSASKRELMVLPLPLWFIVGLSSVVADLAAAIVRVPMETAKMRLQSSVYSSSLQAVHDIRAGGLRPMLRLVVPQIIVHDLPYGFVMWLCYEYLTPLFRAALSTRCDPTKPFVSLISGAVSGCIAGALTVPLDVIKTRTVVMSADRSANITASRTMRSIYESRGLPGFFRGLSARVLWISANVGMYFATFETLKEFLRTEP